MSKEKTNQFGWFRLGGFRHDPLLKREDKRYFEKKLKEKKELGLSPGEKETERELKEFLIVREKVRKKEKDWLGSWLEKFSEKGTWDLARYRNQKDDWL